MNGTAGPLNNSRTNTLQIRTPEGILFSIPLAGPVSRALAWAIDFACIAAAMIAISIIGGLLQLLSRDFAAALLMITYFVLSIGYGIAAEWFWRGQTIGKRVLGLRVMDAEGLKLHFSQIVIRNLIRFVDSLPLLYLLGGSVSLLTPKAQRLGDIAANTVVVRTPAISDPDLEQLLADKYNSLRDHPHLAARLRQQVSPQEAAVALQALLRRDKFEPGARIALFREIADHFRGRVAFPEEATFGVTDEQYVRNVVDILFRERQG